MFESNFPPDKQSCGYTELWNAFKHLTKKASSAEKTAPLQRHGGAGLQADQALGRDRHDLLNAQLPARS